MEKRIFSAISDARLGLLSVLVGVFLPVGAFFFVERYNSRESFMKNLPTMQIPITGDTGKPIFEPVEKLDGSLPTMRIDSGDWIEFSPSYSRDEIFAALEEANMTSKASGDPVFHWRYSGRQVIHKGARVQFRPVLIAGIVFVFLGLVLVVLRGKQKPPPIPAIGAN